MTLIVFNRSRQANELYVNLDWGRFLSLDCRGKKQDRRGGQESGYSNGLTGGQHNNPSRSIVIPTALGQTSG